MSLGTSNPEKVPFETNTDKSDKGTGSHIEDGSVDNAVEHAHLSAGDILRGTAVHEFTPFERKAALVNE